MKQFLATVVIGTLLAAATTMLVLLYWLMAALFRLLQALTYPLQMAWRTLRRSSA